MFSGDNNSKNDNKVHMGQTKLFRPMLNISKQQSKIRNQIVYGEQRDSIDDVKFLTKKKFGEIEPMTDRQKSSIAAYDEQAISNGQATVSQRIKQRRFLFESE